MAAKSDLKILIDKLQTYKRKYYINKLIRGTIFGLSIILTVYLIINSLEYSVRFNSPTRTILFFITASAFLFIIYVWIIDPLVKIFDSRRQLNDQEAAKQVGEYFPSVRDKLLNTLQLEDLSAKENSLISASIEQKTREISLVPFSNAVNLGENKQYLKLLVIPSLALILVLLFIPQLLTESSTRIINFNKEFVPKAPFSFNLENDKLQAFKNEDFTIELSMEGEAIPNSVYLNTLNRRVKLKKMSSNTFEYTFQKIQHQIPFHFQAAGFQSGNFNIDVVNRPNLKSFNVFLDYPAYLNKEDERLTNVGNLQVPEGTQINWHFRTFSADKLQLDFSKEPGAISAKQEEDQIFKHSRTVYESQIYEVKLENKYSRNKDPIEYNLAVIRDEYPKIKLEQYYDTTLYEYIILGGNISDDYGLSNLKIFYKSKKNGAQSSDYQHIIIPIDRNQITQSYYYKWDVGQIDLQQGDQIEYHLQVWDNDGVNGNKSAKTGPQIFRIPSKEEVKKEIQKASGNTKSQIDKTAQKAETLKERIEEIEERLKGRREMDWQDEKMLEELLKEREKLEQEIKKLQELNRANSSKRERFNHQDEQIKEKVEQLQELMDELLDEETKKLYDELKKLLEEQKLEDIQDNLKKLDLREKNLEKELERALELFKRMKFEYKLEELIDELDKTAESQEELSNQTQDKKNALEDIKDDQEDINQQFDELKKDMDDLQELNQDLKYPEPVHDISEEQNEIEQEQQNIQEFLQKNNRKKAGKSQQKSSRMMQKMSKKLQQMQSNMELEMLQENLDHLRDIVDNLVKLSFDQENIMQEFRAVNQSDPRFVELSQKQLKLKDDAQIVEDSLLSLANRVFQIQSFITREVGAMNENIDASLEAIKERKKGLAMSKQQFSMTSINNLAILLDDVLQQMQQQMADAMGKPQKGSKPSKGAPSLSELQKQLNDKIEDLKKSGKSGRPLSEELAKLAAEQERIRKALQEMNEKSNGQNAGEGGLDKTIEKMEETEIDLVNKQLTNKMIERQKEIMTRLLEAEDALRERELDDKREAERPQDYEQKVPKAFEEYIKAKEREIELLKTVPVKLNPYYKKEVNDYFQRIETQ